MPAKKQKRQELMGFCRNLSSRGFNAYNNPLTFSNNLKFSSQMTEKRADINLNSKYLGKLGVGILVNEFSEFY